MFLLCVSHSDDFTSSFDGFCTDVHSVDTGFHPLNPADPFISRFSSTGSKTGCLVSEVSFKILSFKDFSSLVGDLECALLVGDILLSDDCHSLEMDLDLDVHLGETDLDGVPFCFLVLPNIGDSDFELCEDVRDFDLLCR